MGRRIEHTRKISSDRVRKRRHPKKTILIAVEGNNKTEKTYFSNFENGKKSYNITYARGNNTDPLNLVRMLIKEVNELKSELADEVESYCIFDTDTDPNKNKIIAEAIQLANRNNIKVITSTPCIELWFLLHYEYTTAYMNNKEVIRKLKTHYPKYEKNVNLYSDIVENLESAIERAKILKSYQLNNNHIIGTVEANPNTEIYKIVERLMKK